MASASAAAAPGGALAVADKTVNTGSTRARSSSTAFYLSLDRRVGPSDGRLGVRDVPALRAKQASTHRTRTTVPATLAPAAYFLLACADARHKVRESNETNNCRVATGRVMIAAPPVTPAPTGPSAPPVPDGGTTTTTEPPAAVLAIDRSGADYGFAVAGTSSSAAMFSVTNAGTAASGSLSATLSGTNPSEFKITSDACSGATLTPGGHCAVGVDFAPASAGAKSATISIGAAPGGTVSATLTGAGCSTTAKWTVDTARGGDANTGTCAAPFKTITKALSVAAPGDTVKVDPGGYDAAAGETFPLAVPAGVSVVGDTTGRGTNPVTKVVGNVSLAGGAVLEGLWVVGTVTASSSNALVLYNTVNHAGATCIQSGAGTGVVFQSNTVTGCGVGVVVTASGSPSLTNNNITGNGYGVEIDSPATADLSGGGNVLSCSTNADLWTSLSSGTINASNNEWDHTPPTLSTTSGTGGIDIYHPSGSTVVTTGATLVPACA